MIARLGQLTRADRVRRNHALEHAAITILSESHPTTQIYGRSNSRGFFVFGDVSADAVQGAVTAGLDRLRAGETGLAIHPRCGTNLAVAGILTGVAAALTSSVQNRVNRFSSAILASLTALAIAPWIGTAAQKHVTTLAELGDLQIASVEPRRIMGKRCCWVRTRQT